MSTAERLAFSIAQEGRGVHILLWDDQGDLVRALLIVRAALKDVPSRPVFASPDENDLVALKKVVDTRCPLEVEEEPSSECRFSDPIGNDLWILFLQQASSRLVGPWLNGWRRPMSEPPGTLLVVRHADFEAFQRNAPDLASYAGPRIYDASTMLSMVTAEICTRLDTSLPPEIERILSQLPGTPPTRREIAKWIKAICVRDDVGEE
jgi:hypothetical protein